MTNQDPSRDEAKLREVALDFARREKKKIAKRLTDQDRFPPEAEPVSVFMAGSPGAGKTEASIELLSAVEGGEQIIRLDPDDLRAECPGYDGKNAWIFQGPVSIFVGKAIDFALENSQSFLLDGTLSKFDIADQNIERSIKRGRTTQILYVYQDPTQAWEFVKAREGEEGRRIRKADFIDQYFTARDVVNRLKEKYGKQIRVDLLIKNNDASNQAYAANVDRIDNHVPEKYTREQLEKLLSD